MNPVLASTMVMSCLSSSSAHVPFRTSVFESLDVDSWALSSQMASFFVSTTFGRLLGIGCTWAMSPNFADEDDDDVGITSHNTFPFLRARSSVDGFSFLPYDVGSLVLVVTRPLFSLEMSVVSWEQHALAFDK